MFDEKYVSGAECCVCVCVVVAALEVDGKHVSPGIACRAACGSAVSLVCTVNNCTDQLMSDLTVELLSVELVQSTSVKPHASDRRAVFDSNAVAIGCLMSSFPQVRLSH